MENWGTCDCNLSCIFSFNRWFKLKHWNSLKGFYENYLLKNYTLMKWQHISLYIFKPQSKQLKFVGTYLVSQRLLCEDLEACWSWNEEWFWGLLRTPRWGGKKESTPSSSLNFRYCPLVSFSILCDGPNQSLSAHKTYPLCGGWEGAGR